MFDFLRKKKVRVEYMVFEPQKDITAYELKECQTVEHLIKLAKLNSEDVAMVLVNGRTGGLDTVLSDGDRVSLTPASAALKASLSF